MKKRLNRRRFLELSAGATAVTALGSAPILFAQASHAAIANASNPGYTPLPTARQVLSLNPSWHFYRGDISGAQTSSFNDASWELVNVPHTVRLETFNNSNGLNYQGLAWYRRHFALDSSYSGKKIFVRFEGAMQVADVWVNGVSLGEHQGGFTPFVFDITSHVTLNGSDNVLAVQLNNQDNGNVPPGKPEIQLDFNYFGGLYRDVTLIVVNPLHISDSIFANVVANGGVFVTTPSVSGTSATVQIQTHVQNDATGSTSTTVKSYLVDATGTLIATLQSTQTIAAGAAATFVQTTTVSKPNLWSPDSPYLYTVYSEVDNGTTPVDSTSTRVGIRSINFSKANGFSLNGQRFNLNGTNRGHQEYPYIGFAVPASGQYRDALLLKEGGANFVRSAHYPPDPAFLDACDQLGIMVMDSIPGWQYYSSSSQFVNDSYTDVRTMIRRDRNHPSVILWEVSLNETNVPDSYAQTTHSITHAEYPGSQAFSYGGNTADSGTIFDVQNAAYSTSGPAALLVREYGDWEYGGNQSTSRSTRSDGEAAMLLSASNKQQSYNGYLTPNSSYVLAGQATWSGFDYNRGYSSSIAYSGLLDLFRIPKFVYYFYQSQRNPNVTFAGVDSGPMIYIANWWTSTSPKNVTVYSNCSQVKLYLNNTLIATQSPDTGNNTNYLPHAPFTFQNLTWASGTLRADGLINNNVVVSYTARTPGSATRLVVTVDTAKKNLVADGTDLAIVQAHVVDQNGTIVPTNSTSITFSVSGAGTLVGNASIGANPVTAGAGIAAALVYTTKQAGQITITATAAGLQSGNVSVTSVASTVAVVPTPTSGVTPTPGTTPTPTPGGTDYYRLVNRNSGKVLDVNAGSTANGASVIQWTNNGGTNQQWSLVPTGTYYYLVNRKSGKVLDINGASTVAGASAIQWTNTGGTNQQWSLVATGTYYKLVNRNSGLNLDVNAASIADGASVIQWTDNGGTNQQWSLVQV